MKRTVVVTTDLSDASFRVLPHAARAATAGGLGLVVLHVIDPVVEETAFPTTARSLLATRHRDARRRIGEELKKLQLRAHVYIVEKLPEESLTEAILMHSCSHGAVMLAIHSRGAHAGPTRAVLGSVALDVLAQSHVPVLVTGPEIAAAPRRGAYKLLFATDGTPHAEAVARSLTAFALEANVSAWVVHLATEAKVPGIPATRSAQLLGRWLPDGMVHPRAVFPKDPMAREPEQVAWAVEQKRVHAVAVTLRPSWLERKLLKQMLAGELLGRLDVPVILGH